MGQTIPCPAGTGCFNGRCVVNFACTLMPAATVTASMHVAHEPVASSSHENGAVASLAIVVCTLLSLLVVAGL
jgi:hypothetical protein